MARGMAIRDAARAWGVLVAAALALPARADGFRAMAKELSTAGKSAGVGLVAVLPFEPADASNPREGWNIAEKLTTQIVRQRKVRTVERNLLRALMNEARLGETGALGERGARVGRLLPVDAIVTGSFATEGNQATVAARLIDAQTGAILAAVERTVERDGWGPQGAVAAPALEPFAFAGIEGGAPLVPPPPPSSIPELTGGSGLRDAAAADPERVECQNAAERVDELEEGILDLKARYWADQLQKGLSIATLRRNPGSTITDPELKRRFYRRMKEWYAQGSIPALTDGEVRRFVRLDQEAFVLYQRCGL